MVQRRVNSVSPQGLTDIIGPDIVGPDTVGSDTIGSGTVGLDITPIRHKSRTA